MSEAVVIDIDTESAVPAFEQLRTQLADMIRSGALATGTRLPSIRQLASDLGLAPGTVARAFRELESEDLVTSRVRHGTVVAPVRHTAAQSRDQLEEAARAFALAARRLGRSDQQALDAVREQLGRLGT
ncbi:GntR family transcriptional regulator [Pedococcus sp. KACC 23699]|uniref:GntR family transcriptional regulator n=1 Tax=Pedococcus sp. KACC 23699 TaxID=3149228 RepID=A0AAU7JWI0_9MICO